MSIDLNLARENMIKQQIRPWEVLDQRVLDCFAAVPRDHYVPEAYRAVAYSDVSIPLGEGEHMMKPVVEGRMLQALELTGSENVLEIGTGSGFTSAVMARLSARVLSLDRFRTLCEAARTRHETLGLSNILIRQADGSQGAPAEGPFDRIIAWASYESLPRSFVDQLASGGIMIAPIGPGDGVQVMEKLTKLGSRFEREVVGNVRFQPMAAGVAAAI